MLPINSVLLDRIASEEEVAAVAGALQSRGCETDVRAEWEKQPGTGNGAFWIILLAIAVPMRDFLKSFMEALGKKAGESSWEALRSLVTDLREARRGSAAASEGWIEVDDSEGARLMIAGVPDEAYQRRLDLDLVRT